MMKRLLLISALVVGCTAVSAQVRQSVARQVEYLPQTAEQNTAKVKNIILMIPDGCSVATISTARWYQWYKNAERENLAIDPYICGTVRTTCSNAPIGDSAPTTSTYMTGYNSRAGWVSTYPTADAANDIYPSDPSRAYQPLTTVLEAARILYGKSTGLVCTCEFPHATPADCSSHSYDRGRYDWIMAQQVHNSLNVVLGGGAGLLPRESEDYLREKGYGIFRNDIEGMRRFEGSNMWALYAHSDMAYDIDRDPAKEPSLAEMTRIAIEKLSRNEKGFFLMVEGSKVDHAAHNNDGIGMVTDYLAFDQACAEAFEFARRDGNTAVVMLSDHGNSGISIGRRDWGSYARDSKDKLFKSLSQYRCTAVAMAHKLNAAPFEDVQKIFRENCGFELNEREMEALKMCREYNSSPVPKEERKAIKGSLYSSGLSRMIAQFMTDRTGLAFTTNGHTGEEVLLAAYHPKSEMRPMGMLTNIQLNEYLCNLLGTTHESLDQLTAQNFAPHTQLGITNYEMTKSQLHGKEVQTIIFKTTVDRQNLELWIQSGSNLAQLKVRKGKKLTLKSTIEMPSPAIYVDRNETFYVSRDIPTYLGIGN